MGDQAGDRRVKSREKEKADEEGNRKQPPSATLTEWMSKVAIIFLSHIVD